jgi:multidrug efflux pump subunit AcrA (membrane-fusion protein)
MSDQTLRVMVVLLLALCGCGKRTADQIPVVVAEADTPAMRPSAPPSIRPVSSEGVEVPALVSAAFAVTGRLAEIVVQPGDRVEAGQYIGRLDLSATEIVREHLQKAYEESERAVETARMAFLNLKQQAEATPVADEELTKAGAQVEQASVRRAKALAAFQQEQANSQRGILYAPCRGEVEAVIASPGSAVNPATPVIIIRSP